MKKLFGFTLAEVLITIGVIGVVATLTMPTLVQNYKKKVYVASIQRAYNEVANGLVSYMADKNADSIQDTDLTSYSGCSDFLRNYLKTDVNGSSGSFNYSYKSIAGYGNYTYRTFMNSWNYSCTSLKTGAAICVSAYSGDRGTIVIDTNGKSGPNVVGRDMFPFFYFNNGDVGVSSVAQRYYYSYTYCDSKGFGCLGQLISDGWEMKY